MKIELKVQGIGEVPSFKNSKMIVRIKGRPSLITDPKKQKWMDACTLAIESQLASWLLTTVTGTVMGCLLQQQIASSLPLDDSLKWIGSHCVSWRKVSKGQEGVEITIEPLPPAKLVE
jgi:hypothetical protein